MSAVKLIPASGGGSVSLAPPNSTSGSDVTITMPSTSQTLGGSTGKILQVLSTTKSDTASTSATSFTDIGISQAITPSSSSSKILISYNLYLSHTQSNTSHINLVRGSTNIAQPANTSGSAPATTSIYIGALLMIQHNMSYLDSPSYTLGDTITYKLQWHTDAHTIYLNRWQGNDNYHGISTLTLMEVAA